MYHCTCIAFIPAKNCCLPGFIQDNELRAAKNVSFKVFAAVIPKEGFVGGAPPILLFV